MSRIVEFPPKTEQPDLLLGPFETYRVVVEGRAIPGLTGFHDGDGIALVVDGRFSVTFPADLARSAAWLIANAMAVSQGYSHLAAATKGGFPFAPQVTALGEVPK